MGCRILKLIGVKKNQNAIFNMLGVLNRLLYISVIQVSESSPDSCSQSIVRKKLNGNEKMD